MVLGIDLGSNTIRILVMDENFSIVKESERIVGSARGLSAGGDLSVEAMERIFTTLREFEREFDFGLDSICVATEAFRMARNSGEFFDRIRSEFGLDFRIINGEDEAKFIRMAVINRVEKLKIKAQNPLIIDLGGASTEISNDEFFRSFKFGIVRFFNEFKNENEMNENADLITKEAREFINSLAFDSVILTSGVPTTLASLELGVSYASYDANLINGRILKYEKFSEIYKKVANFTKEKVVKMVGENRQDLILAGLILLNSLMFDLKKRDFIVIDDGLREGICIARYRNLI